MLNSFLRWLEQVPVIFAGMFLVVVYTAIWQGCLHATGTAPKSSSQKFDELERRVLELEEKVK